MPENGTRENNLGSRLEHENVHLKPIIEYFVCLRRYRNGSYVSRHPENYALMDLTVLSPNKTLNFLKHTMFLTFIVNLMLFIPNFFISRYYEFSCVKCVRIVYMWLFIYRFVLTLQLIIRMVLIYLLNRLKSASTQEKIYCISVIMSSRGWNMCKRLSVFIYIWYIIGISISRSTHFCNKPQMFTVVCYVMTIYVIRFVFMMSIYRFSFPQRVNIGRTKVLPYINKIWFITTTFNESDYNISSSCGICLEDFSDSDKLKVLKCQHGYHVDCIDLWLQKSATCPLCMKCVY